MRPLSALRNIPPRECLHRHFVPLFSTIMITNELSRAVLDLPLEDRLELARRLVESVVEPAPLTDAVKDGIRRIEDVAAGRVAGLTEDEYRTALQ